MRGGEPDARDFASRHWAGADDTDSGGYVMNYLAKWTLVFLSALGAALGAQSVQVSGGTPSVTLPNAAPWTSIGASGRPMRWEMRIHSFGSDWPTNGINVGPFHLFRQSGTTNAYFGSNFNSDTVNNNGPHVQNCCAGKTDVLVRAQRDVANLQYTFEVCDVVGGNCQSGTERILTFGPPSWAGITINLTTGYSVAFLRWFSSVVPVGTPIPSAQVAGDLGDWEFEGNLNDSSGHGLNMSGGVVAYSPTPAYPPVCNAGAPQAFRAGYPAQLDGTGSMPLDGNATLTYAWQQMSGPSRVVWPRSAGRWPPQPTMSGQNTSQPTITGMVAGSYTFQLTVTDSSQQSTVCTVHHGAVVTDDNGVVITNNPAVDTLLGPMIRFGANPWPWFDDRHKADADVQIANMDTYYGGWFDVADPGTVSVTVNPNHYGSPSVVTGVGTTFTTTFCQGPGNPTVPISGIMIDIWYPTNNPLVPGETGRRMAPVASCQSDTQLTLTVPWTSDVNGGTGLSYGDNANYVPWAYNSAPANYYDNVAAFYALYYRSGIIDYLNAARKLADRFWRCPEINRGNALNAWGTGNGWNGSRSASMMGLVLRAMDSPPYDMWAGLENWWTLEGATRLIPGSIDQVSLPALWDVRETAYALAELSYCALFDTSSLKSTCQGWVSSAIAGMFTTAQQTDGGWEDLQAKEFSWTATPTTVTLTHSSTAVVGNGTSWTCGEFPTSGIMAAMWFTNFSSRPNSNADGDPVAYSPTCTDGQHLTLDRPYAGATGTHGWVLGSPSYDTPFVGYGSYVYSEGLLSMAFDFAAKAIADSDPANSTLARSYNLSAANWIKTYGYESSQKATYYGAQYVNCQAPIQEGPYSPCTSGWTGSSARVINAEGIRGLMSAYAYSKDPSLRAFIDVLYNAMWAKPTTCPAGSTVCVPDGIYLDQFDPGGVDISGVPPSGAAPKWFGQMWGISSLSSWPATRLGGAQPNGNRAFYIGFHLLTVPGAASIRVTATGPDGRESYTECTTSPCAVVVDGVPGARLVELQYLSPSGGVLAKSELPIIQTP
jgi:hypothetical protein